MITIFQLLLFVVACLLFVFSYRKAEEAIVFLDEAKGHLDSAKGHLNNAQHLNHQAREGLDDIKALRSDYNSELVKASQNAIDVEFEIIKG